MPRSMRSILFGALVAAMAVSPASGSAQGWDLAVGFQALGGGFQFADSTYLADQDILGGALNLDLGRGLLLRGYYWKGVEEEWEELAPIYGYGGEVQFDLALFSAIKPFILGGYGVMEFEEGYEDAQGGIPGQTETFIFGGGVGIDLARWFRIDFTARDYLFYRPEVDGEPVPETRYNNLLLTGGVTLTLGRRKHSVYDQSSVSGDIQPVATTQVITVPAGMVVTQDGQTAVVPEGLPPELSEVLEGSSEPLSTVAAQQTINAILAREIGYLDTLYPDQAPLGGDRTEITGERADTLDALLTPRFHEAFEYLAHYESVALMVTLNAQLDEYNVSPDAKDQILASAQEILQQRLAAVRTDGEVFRSQTDSVIAWERAEHARRTRLSPVLGGSFGNGTQFVLGGQVGFAAPWSPSWAIVPEVQIGMGGGGTSSLLQGSLRYYLPRPRVEPYAGLGLGVMVLSNKVGDRSGSGVILTPVFGVEVPTTNRDGRLGRTFQGWFAEYQALDFFDTHRLLVGVSWGF